MEVKIDSKVNTNLSEIINIIIWIRRFPYEEITMQQTNLMKLIFVDSVINKSIRIPTLRRNEVRALHCRNVTVAGCQRIVLDVEILFVVDLLHFIFVHPVVVGGGGIAVAVVGAG